MAGARQLSAVDLGARHHDALRNELAVHGVPVDAVAVPVLLLLFAEDQPQAVGVGGRRDHQDDVVALQDLVRRGDRHAAVAPYARDDEAVVAVFGDLVHALAEYGRVGQVVAGDEDVLAVLGVGPGKVRGADEELAYDDQRQNHAHHAQRIGQRAAERGAVGGHSQLFEGPLRRTQRGGVGRGAAEDAGHVGDRDVQREAQRHGQQSPGQHQQDGRRDEAGPLAAQRVEESRPYLQPECVDEKHQPEALGVDEHLRIDRKAEVACQDADEKDEGGAQGDAAEPYLAQPDSQGRDQRQDHHGLQRRMLYE